MARCKYCNGELGMDSKRVCDEYFRSMGDSMKSEFGICMECGEEYRIMDRTVDDAIVVDGVCPNCSQDALDRARFNLGRSDGGWEGDE